MKDKWDREHAIADNCPVPIVAQRRLRYIKLDIRYKN